MNIFKRKSSQDGIAREPEKALLEVLSEGDSARIAETVRLAEERTSGEIVVKLSAATADGVMTEIAQAEYQRLGLASHPHQHGVLFYVSLNRRAVEIVAGPEAAEQLPAELWRAAASAVADGFRSGHPTDGIVRAVELVAQPLAEKFPQGDTFGPELPNVSEDHRQS